MTEIALLPPTNRAARQVQRVRQASGSDFPRQAVSHAALRSAHRIETAIQISSAAGPHYIRARWDWVESRSRSRFLIEHDLRANALRLSRGKTATHFSGSCSRRGMICSLHSRAGAPAVIVLRYPHQIEGRPGGLVDLRESPRRQRYDLASEPSRLIAPPGAHVVHTKTLLALSEFALR